MSDAKKTEVTPVDPPAAVDAKEVVKMIREMQEAIGERNTDLKAKLDEMEVKRQTADVDLGKMRDELERMQDEAEKRENTIREIERRNVLRIEQDPAQNKAQGIELFGMMMRRELCRHFRIEMPERFASVERSRVDQYLTQRVERATLDIQTAQGGYFMPTPLQMDVYDTLDQISAILALIDMQTGVPTKGTMPTLTGRPTLQYKRASSDTKMTASDPTFSYFDWSTSEAYVYFPVDNWMLELSPIQLGQRMLGLTRDAFAAGLANHLINAVSTGYNGDTGILADTTRVTRMAGGTFESLTSKDLSTVRRAVLARSRNRGVWLGGPYFLDVIDEIPREGLSSLLKEKGDGTFMIKGNTFVEDEGMPTDGDSAADAAFFAFGDPMTWAMMMAGTGLQITSDASYLFGNGQTAFRGVAQIDLVRKPGNTWTLVKTKA